MSHGNVALETGRDVARSFNRSPRMAVMRIYLSVCLSVCLSVTVWTVVQTVLTATFNSYGNRHILTSPQNQYPLNDRQKNRHNLLHQRGDLLFLYQIW